MATFRTTSLEVVSEHGFVAGYRLLDNTQVNNGDSVPLVNGMSVAICGDGVVCRASAANTAFTWVAGIVWNGAGLTLPVLIRKGGRLNLTLAEWDAQTGESGGLLPMAPYYLGLTLGTLTRTPPDQPGQSVVVLGKALTPHSLIIGIAPPILL